MNIELVQFSIVVAASEHNPSLINPDFLTKVGIVDEQWEWNLAGDPITTPPFSTIPYNSGVTVTVDSSKLQVIDAKCKNPADSKITEIVDKYIDALPHIPYRAFGINFNSIIRESDPSNYLKNHFLKAGGWDNDINHLESVGIKLVYPIDVGKLTLNIDHVQKENDKKDEAILVNANFHRECDVNSPSNGQISQFLSNIGSDWGKYLTLVSETLTRKD